MKFIAGVAVCSTILCQAHAAVLEDIIYQALMYHPSIKAEGKSYDASADVIQQALAGYGPVVDLRVGIGREKVVRHFDTTNINLTPPTDGDIQGTRTDPTVAIKQMLFDGFATSARVRRAWHQSSYAKNKLEATRDTTIIDAAIAAIDVRRLRRLLKKNAENLSFHKKMRARVAEQVQAGTAPNTDLHQCSARLEDVELARVTIEGDLRTAEIKFEQTVGLKAPTIPKIKLNGNLLSSSEVLAIKQAHKTNAVIKIAEEDLSIAKTNLDESNSKFMPQVTLELEGERQRNVGGSRGTQSRATAMVVARFNALNGGQDYFKRQENCKRISEARSRVDVARLGIDKTLRSALNEMAVAQKKSQAYERLKRQKKGVRDNYTEEYNLGKRTLIDILDSANEYFLAESNQVTADASADINTVVASVSTGGMQDHLRKLNKLPVVNPTRLCATCG